MKKLIALILVMVLSVATMTACNPSETFDNVKDTVSGWFGSNKGETENVICTEEAKYNEALSLIEKGKYEEAYEIFKALGGYKDSAKHLARFIYFPTVVNYDLFDRSGVMTVTLGDYNLPIRVVSVGILGVKDGKYTYDSKGNITSHVLDHDGAIAAYDYMYDANNNMIRAEYSEEGVVLAVHEYVYDENEQLINERYSVQNVLQYEYDNFYDEKGNMIRSEEKAPEAGKVYIYTYDANGNILNERGESLDGSFYNFASTYDAEGKLATETYTKGDVQYTITYSYDDAGNCIKEEFLTNDGIKETLVREYDAHGNAVKEVYTDYMGEVQTVESQFTLTYATIDVPAETIKQLSTLYNVGGF